MLSERVNPTDGIQFARDLRRIRERKGLSLEQVNERTRIATAVLRDFEKNALFDHAMFNEVYLRSLVRSYAEATDISVDAAIEALESALIGMYRGELAKHYLDEGGAGFENTRFRFAGSTALGGIGEEETEESEEEPEEVDEATNSGASIRSINSVDLRPPHGSEEPGAGSGLVLPRTGLRTLWISVAGIAVVCVAAYLLYSLFNGSPAAEVRDTRPASVQTEATPPQPVRPPPVVAPEPVVLGETIAAVVKAVGGPLRPVRVKVDNDLRRPYWINEDSSMQFSFRNRFVLEDALDLLRLEIEGVAYPHDATAGRVVLTRDSTQAFLERARR